MLNFSLSKEQEEVRAKFRDFAQRWMVPNRLKYDDLAEFPWPIVKAGYEE